MKEKVVDEFMDVSESDILPKPYLGLLSEINSDYMLEAMTAYAESIVQKIKNNELKEEKFVAQFNGLPFEIGIYNEKLLFESKTPKISFCYNIHDGTIHLVIVKNGSGINIYKEFHQIDDNGNIIEFSFSNDSKKVGHIKLYADSELYYINSTIKVENGKIDFCGMEGKVREAVSRILHYKVVNYTNIGLTKIFSNLLFFLQTPPDRRDNIYCLLDDCGDALTSSENLHKYLCNNFFQHNKKEFVVIEIGIERHIVAATVFRDGRMMIADSANIFGNPNNGTVLKEFRKKAEITGYKLQNGSTCAYYSGVTASLIACCEKERLEQIYKKSKEYREANQTHNEVMKKSCKIREIKNLVDKKWFMDGSSSVAKGFVDLENYISIDGDGTELTMQEYPAELLDFSADISKQVAILFNDLHNFRIIRTVPVNVEQFNAIGPDSTKYLNSFSLKLLEMQPIKNDLFIKLNEQSDGRLGTPIAYNGRR